jgi:hypothetical protein
MNLLHLETADAVLYICTSGGVRQQANVLQILLYQTSAHLQRRLCNGFKWDLTKDVGFEVLTDVDMKSYVFCDIMVCVAC